MKHVLITGGSNAQTGQMPRLGWQPFTVMLREALTEAGYRVTAKPAAPGEDLSDVDCAVVGQTPLEMIGAPHIYGALDVIRRARSERTGLLFLVDDWKINKLVPNIGSMLREPDRLVRGVAKAKGSAVRQYPRNREWAVEHLDELTGVLQALAERPWPPTITPLFSWGRRELLHRYLPTRQVIPVDRTAYVPDYGHPHPPDAERYGVWVMGALGKHSGWMDALGLSWPVRQFGAKGNQLKNPELAGLYARSWGVLNPPYLHAGSGWWRNRFVYTALSGAILLSARREVEALGPAYAVLGPDVERLSLSVSALRELADAQREALFSCAWSKEQVQNALRNAVETAIQEVQ